jgi:hypothetical protein
MAILIDYIKNNFSQKEEKKKEGESEELEQKDTSTK